MKKILLTVLVLLFTDLSVNATTQVFYGNTGVPAFRSHGAGVARSVNHFGSNAAFTPANRRAAGIRNREIQRQKAITRAISSMGNQNYGNSGYNGYSGMRTQSSASMAAVEPSRFSRNYTPSRATKSYTRDGITYYN